MTIGKEHSASSSANPLKIKKYMFHIKKSKDGQYYWTFHNTFGNTETIAQSETYVSRQSCKDSITLMKEYCATATVQESLATAAT